MEQTSGTLRVHLALLFAAVLFSANYIISKSAMGSFNPLTFAWLRVVGSAIVLNAIVPRRSLRISRSDNLRIAGLAMLGVVINQTLFLSGLALTSAHVAAIIITTIPIFALGAAIAMRLERASAARIGGIALAAAGALLVVGGEGLINLRSALGTLLLLGNCLSYAFYLVLSRTTMRRLSARAVLARMFVMAAPLMLPFATMPLLHEQWSAIPPRAWIALAAVIAGPTVGAYLINGWALAHAETSLVAVYTYLQPVLTAILAAAFLGEKIRAIVIVAAAVIFAGVYLAGRPAPPAACPEAVPGSPE